MFEWSDVQYYHKLKNPQNLISSKIIAYKIISEKENQHDIDITRIIQSVKANQPITWTNML